MKFRPGDVVLVNLGTNTEGHEQSGVRPGVFVSQEGGVSILIPLSSNAARLQFKGTVRIMPSMSNKLAKSSVALVFQLRAVDSRRLLHRIGSSSPMEKRTVNKMLHSVASIK